MFINKSIIVVIVVIYLQRHLLLNFKTMTVYLLLEFCGEFCNKSIYLLVVLISFGYYCCY